MKKLTTLFEISSSDFRSKIRSLGYSEKGSELTSGGDLQPDFLDILTKLLDEWKKSNPNCVLTFTSGNDTFHKGITSYTSRHTKGEAVDVTLDKTCHSSFITLLNSYKSKYNGFSFIDEYTNPTSKATAGHFHLSYRSGAPEGGGKDYSSSESTSSSGSTATSASTTPEVGSYSSAADSIFSGAIKQGLSSLGLPVSESRLEKDINKIKKLLK
jgi:hypothetical protein